jgi:hypothetical protein
VYNDGRDVFFILEIREEGRPKYKMYKNIAHKNAHETGNYEKPGAKQTQAYLHFTQVINI